MPPVEKGKVVKRFTATEKWAKPWFQELPPHLKCFWLYVCDNTDAAGVWEPNFKLASFQIGKTVTEADLSQFGERIVKLENGKFAVVSFVAFQYGTLSKDCKAHIPVFRALEKHSLPGTLCIGYPKAMHSLQEEDKEKEEGTEAEKEEGSPEGGVNGTAHDFTGLPKSLDSPLFRQAWGEYVDYRKERRLQKLNIRSVSERWRECELWGVEDSVNSIRQTIANGWNGLFPPKHQQTRKDDALHKTPSKFGF